LKASVAKLRYLTPGDFNAAVRKSGLTAAGLTTSGLVQALEAEVAIKSGVTKRGIGFAAQM
jgi:hypothetical protein